MKKSFPCIHVFVFILYVINTFSGFFSFLDQPCLKIGPFCSSSQRLFYLFYSLLSIVSTSALIIIIDTLLLFVGFLYYSIEFF